MSDMYLPKLFVFKTNNCANYSKTSSITPTDVRSKLNSNCYLAIVKPRCTVFHYMTMDECCLQKWLAARS